jgi:hypothetical protein
MNCKKCEKTLDSLEITLWKNKCHSCAAKAYKFVIMKLSNENEELTAIIKRLENK